MLSVWLGGGFVAVLLNRQSHTGQSVPVASLMTAVGSGVLTLVTPEPWSTAFVWITLGLVNVALAVAGIRRSPAMLPGAGLVLTTVALALVLLRSFASLAVIAAAGVICAAAALGTRTVAEQPEPTVEPH